MNKSTLTSKEIVKLLRSFLAKACVEVETIEASLVDDKEYYNIVTPDSAILIGSGGETLNAIDYLLQEVLRREGVGDKRISIDINNYRRARIDKLRERVKKIALELRSTQETYEFEPMNSYERLIIHNVVSEEPNIESSSAGEGRDRRVKLSYKKEV